jgi:acylphosphatase
MPPPTSTGCSVSWPKLRVSPVIANRRKQKLHAANTRTAGASSAPRNGYGNLTGAQEQANAAANARPIAMNSAASQKRYEVYYSGRVQGVGFRANARYLARRYPVTGFVRNLPDGRVHLVVEGPVEQVTALLDEIDDSMAGNIVSAPRTVSPATGQFTSFSIA